MSSDTISEKWSDRFKFFNRYGLPGTVSYRAALKELGFSKKFALTVIYMVFSLAFFISAFLGYGRKGWHYYLQL